MLGLRALIGAFTRLGLAGSFLTQPIARAGSQTIIVIVITIITAIVVVIISSIVSTTTHPRNTPPTASFAAMLGFGTCRRGCERRVGAAGLGHFGR